MFMSSMPLFCAKRGKKCKGHSGNDNLKTAQEMTVITTEFDIALFVRHTNIINFYGHNITWVLRGISTKI